MSSRTKPGGRRPVQDGPHVGQAEVLRMSKPIWVSLTETLTSTPLAAMRASMRRYSSRAAAASASS